MSNNIVWHHHHVTKLARTQRNRHKPAILWLTGLSGSGKSTIANVLEEKLFVMGAQTYLLDGDNLRHGLNSDLGFSTAERAENIRRVGEVARLFVDAGSIVITSFISPYRKDRQTVRQLVEKEEFIEVYVDAPLEVCEARDPKGLYARARAGEIADFTGISSPYEAPEQPEIHIRTATQSVASAAEQIALYLKDRGFFNG